MKYSDCKSVMLFAAFLSMCTSVNIRAEQQAVSSTTTTTTTQTPDGDTVSKVVETSRQVVTTPVPAAKEVIAAPAGYDSCFNVEAGWFNNIWIPMHRVCQYQNATQGSTWIEGYWGCDQATAEGVCSNWEWKPGRWEKSFVVY
jgi:hypothetical protein